MAIPECQSKKKKKVIKYLRYKADVALFLIPKNSDISKVAGKSNVPIPNSTVDSLAENKL